jgi:endo-1,4-beta-xylanase
MAMSDVRTLLASRIAAILLAAMAASCLRPAAHGSAAEARSAAVPTGEGAAAPSVSPAAAGLPATLAWTSTGPIIAPVSDAKHELVAIKDPTVVRYNDRWHVYASSVGRGGVYGLLYVSFADWSDAPKAPVYYMAETRGFDAYVAAPQLFYFTSQKTWYLVFQSGPPMFATNDDPGDPTKWTSPAPFFAKTPPIVDQNGGWLDFWVICDAERCHLFFSNDKGRWYRSTTALAKFPYGFGDPVVVLEDPEAGRIFEASNVYKIASTGKYLALIEAFDKSSAGRRYYRSWVAETLDGPWTPMHESGTSPFAGRQNVTFDGAAWTEDISHGEMIRAGYDETMAIDGAKLQYLYQGFDRAKNASDYNSIPWRLGLLSLR